MSTSLFFEEFIGLSEKQTQIHNDAGTQQRQTRRFSLKTKHAPLETPDGCNLGTNTTNRRAVTAVTAARVPVGFEKKPRLPLTRTLLSIGVRYGQLQPATARKNSANWTMVQGFALYEFKFDNFFLELKSKQRTKIKCFLIVLLARVKMP